MPRWGVWLRWGDVWKDARPWGGSEDSGNPTLPFSLQGAPATIPRNTKQHEGSRTKARKSAFSKVRLVEMIFVSRGHSTRETSQRSWELGANFGARTGSNGSLVGRYIDVPCHSKRSLELAKSRSPVVYFSTVGDGHGHGALLARLSNSALDQMYHFKDPI